MPERDPGPSVKDDELYEKLRDAGNSQEKSARIANAAASRGRSTCFGWSVAIPRTIPGTRESLEPSPAS